jgi:hypothetical protein
MTSWYDGTCGVVVTLLTLWINGAKTVALAEQSQSGPVAVCTS